MKFNDQKKLKVYSLDVFQRYIVFFRLFLLFISFYYGMSFWMLPYIIFESVVFAVLAKKGYNESDDLTSWHVLRCVFKLLTFPMFEILSIHF
jgi:hypothetical protein